MLLLMRRTIAAISVPVISTPAVSALLACVMAASAAPDARAQIPASAYQELHWRMVGPFRGGRTRAVAGVPSRPNVFYMAQVDGGVWKTDDAGRTWRPIFDGQPTQSVGAIAAAPSNPDIVYVGTGEGLHRPDLSVGDGVYKSTDAGRTWKHMGLPDAQQIPQIAVDPRNPDRVFAAVLGHPYGPSRQRGVFRSLDGGRTWQRVLYVDEDTGASDIEIDPRNPAVVYAALWQARLGPWEDQNHFEGAGGGLYKSTDGGKTWRKLRRGLPASAVQFDLAIAPSRPSRLFVELSTTEEGEYASGKGNGLYRSDDAGESWTRITTDERPLMKIGGGDLMVPVVDPRDPDVVYVASLVTVKSVDGGRTWRSLRGAPGGDDYQNIWINPNDSNTFVLVSDQGAVVTVNGGRTWSSWYNQPTAQLYHVSATADEPYRVCSGQQESGSVCIASRGGDGTIGYRDWRPVGVIEYGYVAPDPRDPDIVYGAGRNHVSRYRWSTGQVQDVTPIPVRGSYRVERTQPILFSPVRPDILYYAANVLFESRTGGKSWRIISPDLAHPSPGLPRSIGALGSRDPRSAGQRGAIYALAPSYRSASTIWAGTDDGKIWVTRDGGKHWADVTPAALTGWSKVTQLDTSRTDDSTVYASVSRFRVDDLAPYIYRTHDGGKTWSLIVGGLPPGPVDAVRADPVRKGLLYASTENGVWVSFDDGGRWQSLQLNLPRTSVRDIIVHGDDLVVATHGRGFWILDDISPLRQAAASMQDTLFRPAPARRVPRSNYPDTPVPPDEPWAENPPTGAIIDYYLARAASGPVTLEIADARGQVVRRYSSSDPPELTDDELAVQLIPVYWVRPRRRLATGAGMHRWVWDLRRERPLADSYEYPINAAPHATPRVPEGPRVMPGRYTVRLAVGGKTLTAPLEVRMDARSKVPRAVLARQNQLEQDLADALTRSSDALLQARSTSEQLARLAARRGALAGRIAAVARTVEAVMSGSEEKKPASGRERPPTLSSLNGDLMTLYRMVEVDAPPTEAQLAAAKRAQGELTALVRSWNAIRAGELARLNAAFQAAGLPVVRPELRPAVRQSSGAEE